MHTTARTTDTDKSLNVASMRESAHRVLGPDSAPDAMPPAGEELQTLTTALRRHIDQLAPEVEQAARRLPESAPTRTAALACAREACGKLRAAELGYAGLAGSVMYARRLARVLAALCDHYEIVSAGIDKTPVQVAFERLAEHCLRCPTCRTVDEQGAHAGLPCEEESRLYEEYRAARAAHARTVRLAQRGGMPDTTA
ncbi:DUF6415 family natural product biosynthesis protein [Streptomyces sp. NPDC004135]